jgi:hypothetical protein
MNCNTKILAILAATTITAHAQWHGECRNNNSSRQVIVNTYYYYPTYQGGFDYRNYDARYERKKDNSRLVLFGIKTFIPMHIFQSPRHQQTYTMQPYRKVIIE